MNRLPLTKAQFDAKRPHLEALATDWADRECTSFDDAVHRRQDKTPASGTIWTMPAIDSKHVVALLVELEPVMGCDLPCSLARAGGYPSRLLLVTDLLARIRAQCLDTPTPTDQDSAADVRGRLRISTRHCRPSTNR